MGGNKLVEDNINLVYFLINKYYPSFRGNEDVQQEGMMGLCKAAKTFDDSKGAQFSTYATMCILNQIRIFFRQDMKHNCVLSADTLIKDDFEDGKTFIDTFIGDEDVSLDKIQFEQFYNTLNDTEKELIQLLSKYNQGEIGKLYGLKHNTISYRKRRLGRKWREFNSDRK